MLELNKECRIILELISFMKTKTKKIQRVEFCGWDGPLCCPFCGKEADVSKRPAKVCKHTLFVATSEGGFEYRSARYNKLMKIEGVENEDIGSSYSGYDGFTDRLPCQDAVKFTVGPPAPANLTAYYGFAPA
jgi:hypothetical protein